MPPGLSIFAAFSRISFCLLTQRMTFSKLHSLAASGFLRNIPSPEQGASTRILSKEASNLAASLPLSSFKTTVCRSPIRSTFLARILALSGTNSLLIKMPPPPLLLILQEICTVFPPGAAQRSSTQSPGCGSRSETGSMALGS